MPSSGSPQSSHRTMNCKYKGKDDVIIPKQKGESEWCHVENQVSTNRAMDFAILKSEICIAF